MQVPGPPPSGVGVVRSISSCDLEGPGANPVTSDHFQSAVECKEPSDLSFKQDLVGASPTSGATFPCVISIDSDALVALSDFIWICHLSSERCGLLSRRPDGPS